MESLMNELRGLGAILLGTLEEYYSACGKKGCACSDKKKPKKHGPYYRLSYSIRGKNSCLFVKKSDAEKVRKMTEAHRKAKNIISEVSITNLELMLKHGVDGCEERLMAIPLLEERTDFRSTPKALGTEKAVEKALIWRERVMKYQKRLEKRRVEARDLRASRDKWRKEALLLRRKARDIEYGLESTRKDKFMLAVEI